MPRGQNEAPEKQAFTMLPRVKIEEAIDSTEALINQALDILDMTVGPDHDITTVVPWSGNR